MASIDNNCKVNIHMVKLMDNQILMDYTLFKIITMHYITVENLFENEQEFIFSINFISVYFNVHLIICLKFCTFVTFLVKSFKDTKN
jgi:hypothetical protein